MKPIAEMTHDELVTYANFVAGLSPTELKKEFKDDAALRAFLEEAQRFRGTVIDEMTETTVGWDATDKTLPDDEITKRVEKKKKILKASIKKTGSQVSISDVQRALAALNDEDDEDEDDNPAKQN